MTTWESVKEVLAIFGAGGLVSSAFALIYTKTRKKATADISKTESENIKYILENKLLELNVDEIINRKVDAVRQEYKAIIHDMQKEHFAIKHQMQERLNKVLEEKIVVERENEMLHQELKQLELKLDEQEGRIKSMQKEIETLKSNQNGK